MVRTSALKTTIGGHIIGGNVFPGGIVLHPFIYRLIRVYQKVEFEAGVNEPIQIRTRNPLLAGPRFLAEVLGRAGFNKYTRRWYRYDVNERIVEIPFLYRTLALPLDSKVLEFGCNRSKVGIELASLGYRVTGVDLLPYKYTHRNFEFRRGNFLGLTCTPESFDAITAISAVEHSGLGFYGDAGDPDGDTKVMDRFFEILRPGGLLVLTVPFGLAALNNFTRIYDGQSLATLLRRFTIEQEEYYLRDAQGSQWNRATKDQTAAAGFGCGVACILGRKPAGI